MAERVLRVNIVGDERDLLRAFSNSSRATKQFEAKMAGTSRSVRNVFAAAGIGLGAAGIIRALRSTVGAALSFESSFAGVRKTVDATEPQLQALATSFRRLALEIPVSVDELNRIGEAAGQLGIQRKGILDFTKTVAALGATTNLASEQAADALARLANITQTPQDQFDNLGSTIADLGNRLAATESEIVDFGLRIAAAGKIVGLTVDETLAIAGAFSSVGVEAEAGGTAVSKVFIALANSVKSGGKQLELFASTAGVSTAEFRKQFETNTAGAFTSFVEGLKRIDDEGGNVFETLKSLGLTDVRLIRAFLSISQSGDILARSLRVGSRAWRENSALQIEAAKRYETTASKLQIFQNRVNDLQITLGNVLAPALLQIVTPLGEWLEQTENQERVQRALINVMKDARAIFDGVRAVVQPLAEATKALADRMGGLSKAVELLLITMVVAKVVGFGSAITGLGTAAAGTTTRVKLLQGALLRLGAIGVITLSIEFLTNYDEIQAKFTKLFRLGPKALSKEPIERLEQLREKLAKTALFYGQNSKEARKFSDEIARLNKQLGLEAASGRPEEGTGARDAAIGAAAAATAQTKAKSVQQEIADSLAGAAKAGDAIIAKITRQVAAQEDLNRQLRDSETRAAHLRDLIRADPDNARLQQRLADELTKQASLQEQIATAAEATAAATRAQVVAMFDLREAQAGLTKSLQDDLRIAQQREQNLKRLSDLNRGDLDIAQQLVAATQKRRDVEQQITQNQRDQRQARQFRQLGLTATGEKRIPGIEALRGRGASLEEQVKGTFLDTPKTAAQFARIAAVLALGPKKVGRAVRAAIQQMFKDINDALDEQGGKVTAHRITDPRKITDDLGLTPEQLRALNARLISRSASGSFRTTAGQGAFGFPTGATTGVGGMVINGPITVVADDPDAFMRELGKKGRRAVKSRGGRFGGNRGL